MNTPQLKIIMGSSPTNTLVYIDDEPVGLIQNIKVEVSVDNPFPNIEITFPNLFDKHYQSINGGLTKDLAYHIERLEKIPGVTIKLKELFE